MKANELWMKINNQIKNKPIEIPTVPKNFRQPLWFKVYFENNKLYVTESSSKKPSCNISKPRKISEKDFKTVFEYYFRWKEGEVNIRHKVSRISRNTAYIFGLISYFLKE
jgi:hypothetical protein